MVQPLSNDFYHYDGLGSVILLTDAKGRSETGYLYDAWGSPILPTPPINPFRFAGQALDPTTGLYYLRARYYDSSVGRFMSKDPVSHGPNQYSYASSNPLRYADPTGLTVADVSQNNSRTELAIIAVNDPTVLSTLTKQAACGLLSILVNLGGGGDFPLCGVAGSLPQVKQGFAQVSNEEEQDPQFPTVVSSCIGQVGNNIGGDSQTTGGVRQCVQSNYPYIGPNASNSLLSKSNLCSEAEEQGVALTDCRSSQ